MDLAVRTRRSGGRRNPDTELVREGHRRESIEDLAAAGRRGLEIGDGYGLAHRQAPVRLQELLETVAEFRSASLELIAWESVVGERTVVHSWHRVINQGLMRRGATDPVTRVAMYILTARGRANLGRGRTPLGA